MKKLSGLIQVLGLVGLSIFSAVTMAKGDDDLFRVYPTGSVGYVGQVQLFFGSDVVPAGDPRNDAPAKLFCREANSSVSASAESEENSREIEWKQKDVFEPKVFGKWLNPKQYVMQLDKELVSGTRCRVVLNEGLVDLQKKSIKADAFGYIFEVHRLDLYASFPYEWDRIDPDQYFLISANEDLNAESVAKLVFFEVAGLPDKIPAKLVSNVSRDWLLSVLSYRSAGSGLVDLMKRFPDKPWQELPAAKRFVVITPAQRLPEGVRVVLHWPKQITSQRGAQFERDYRFEYNVIPAFSAKMNCLRTRADAPCSPIGEISLSFSYPVPEKYLKQVQLIDQKGRVFPLASDLSPTEEVDEGERSGSTLVYSPPFSSGQTLTFKIPSDLKDEKNRSLNNKEKFPLKFEIDEAPPLVKFSAQFGLLERYPQALLPVSIRNIEKKLSGYGVNLSGTSLKPIAGNQLSMNQLSDAAKIIEWYRKVTRGGDDWDDNDKRDYRARSIFEKDKAIVSRLKTFELPTLPASHQEIEVIGIPLSNPGFYVLEIKSPKLGAALIEDKSPMFVNTAALVTNMAVHLKLGNESSLVWVTQLSDGQVVEQAKVALTDANGVVLAMGVTDKRGVATFGKLAGVKGGYRYDGGGEVFAFVQKGDDLSFVSSYWDKGIESYRFNVNRSYAGDDEQRANTLAHTVLDRMVLKAGDTVNMKHFIRRQVAVGFDWVNSSQLPRRVFVQHLGSDKIFSFPVTFDAKGSAVSRFLIPKDAPLGSYAIYLSSSNKEELSWPYFSTASFVVSEFRLPLMRAQIDLGADKLVVSPQDKEILSHFSAQYLSGGAASSLPIKVRSKIDSSWFDFESDLFRERGYVFFSPQVVEGVISDGERPWNVPYYEDDMSEGSSDEGDGESETASSRASEQELGALDDPSAAIGPKGVDLQLLRLDAQGMAKTNIPVSLVGSGVSLLQVEMEYMDPSGETRVARKEARLFPSSAAVGLQTESWYAEPGKTVVKGVVLGVDGSLMKHHRYRVEAFERRYISHRKRLVGGFYAFENQTKTTSKGVICEGETDDTGRFECVPKLTAGDYVIQASVLDQKGRASFSNIGLTVYAKGTDRWWAPSDSDRIDLIFTKPKYAVDEKARVVVKTPFAKANALVTVEREGILDAFVVPISRDEPHVDIPIKPHYAPNVFVSVLLIRGRVAEPKPTGLVDLAKPAMKMGLAELKVSDDAYRLTVDVSTDRSVYRPRDKVKASIKVSPPKGQTLPADTELVIFAVDDALSLLKRNTSVDVLGAMLLDRALSVYTSSGQNQVIGRRHFGLKAMAAGGDGSESLAMNDSRRLFEPAVFWRARVKPDANGVAEVEFNLNDALSSFRVSAVASGDKHLFGYGDKLIQSSQEINLYSGFSPVVRSGDVIDQSFTVRNATDKDMLVEGKVTFSGISLAPISVEAKTIAARGSYTFTVPMKLGELGSRRKDFQVQISVKDSYSGAQDQVSFPVKVDPLVATQVYQTLLFELNDKQPYVLPIQQPQDAIRGEGGVSFELGASMVDRLPTVVEYMRNYPYACLEQKMSKATALSQTEQIKQIVSSLPTYMSPNGMLNFFPPTREYGSCGSLSLTLYVMDLLDQMKMSVPQTTKQPIISALTNFFYGRSMEGGCRFDSGYGSLHKDELRVLVLDVLSRYGAFSPAMLDSIQVSPTIWRNRTLVAWYELLEREKQVAQRDVWFTQVKNELKARLYQQGSMIVLQDPKKNWWSDWDLFSSPDQNFLRVLNLVSRDPVWRKDDLPKMVRGLYANMKHGVWDNTHANVLGVIFFNQLADQVVPLTGQTSISSPDKVLQTFVWNKSGQKESKPSQKSWQKSWDMAWPEKAISQPVQLSLTHQGNGSPWVKVALKSAILLKKPLNMGYAVERKVTPVYQAKPKQWTVGDVAEIEITVRSFANQPWVAIRDPIPAGATHLGNSLDGESDLLNDRSSSVSSDWRYWYSAYEEKSQTHFTAYSEFLSEGKYRFKYRIRLNNPGSFHLPPTRVEALYSKDTFGETPNPVWVVKAEK
jgi:uncharacterized protein YfaS (alpha-2-macroglobulin family)